MHASRLRMLAAAWAVALIAAMSWSCSNNNEAFQSAYAAALERVKGGADALSTLMALDQEFPDQLSLKREIAAMLITKGEIESAEVYLSVIEKMAPRKDKELNAAVAGVRARIALARQEWAQALAAADKALALDPQGSGSAGFSKGRALAALGRVPESVDAFKAAFATSGDEASADDWMAYVSTLSDADPGAALAALAEYDSRFPYEPGMGLVESALREKSGDLAGAVYAVCKDVEYARAVGAIDVATALDRLAQVRAALGGMAGSAEGTAALDTCDAFIRGDWVLAQRGLSAYRGDQPMPSWMYLASLARTAPLSPEQLDAYGRLAATFSDLPSYWHVLLTSMERASSGASAADRRRAAELCIDAAPEGPHASDARRALALSIGLGSEAGSSLLTKAEIENLGARSVGGGGAEVLDPIYRLLTLPDNDYTLYAVGMLKGLSAEAFYRAIFSERARSASGRLLERLTYVLNE